MKILTAKELCDPILSEDSSFWFVSPEGEWTPALGFVRYLSEIAVIDHTGSTAVAKMIFAERPRIIRLNGKPYSVSEIAKTPDGRPRIFVDVGYRDIFGEGRV